MKSVPLIKERSQKLSIVVNKVSLSLIIRTKYDGSLVMDVTSGEDPVATGVALVSGDNLLPFVEDIGIWTTTADMNYDNITTERILIDV